MSVFLPPKILISLKIHRQVILLSFYSGFILLTHKNSLHEQQKIVCFCASIGILIKVTCYSRRALAHYGQIL
tara:strand:+ start:3990 stop:4205 length:216 start_codon:yes stop_codon:yes gene_type:complete